MFSQKVDTFVFSSKPSQVTFIVSFLEIMSVNYQHNDDKNGINYPQL